jgi:hypothetical protein
MPVYCFECSRSGTRIDVIRDVDLRDDLPTEDESIALGPPPAGGWAWVRRILPPKIAFGESWSYDGRGLKGRH